jgi:two-component sensor histidine kinase
LLKEANHRIKNHLQMLANLTHLEAIKVQGAAALVVHALEDRLAVIAAAHEGLYSAEHHGEVFADALLHAVARALTSDRHPVIVQTEPDIVLADNQVTPVALAVNEGVANALKHAFPGGRPGRIEVRLTRLEGSYELTVEDEGVGLKKEGRHAGGLGVRIVEGLARQLGGHCALTNGPRGGSLLRMTFPTVPQS